MIVQQLIDLLQKMPPTSKVYFEGGEYKGDYREIRRVEKFSDFGQKGVLLDG